MAASGASDTTGGMTLRSAPVDLGKNGCKWCRRAWDSPNPVEDERGEKPTLQRRKDRSLECRSCPVVLAK
eukprot:2624007-Alexandrium_andersonii.AAC.1